MRVASGLAGLVRRDLTDAPTAPSFALLTLRDSLEIPPECLLPLDRFEQRLEVALAESPAALALDDLEEERRPILDRAREQLQQVALVVAIDEDAELADDVDAPRRSSPTRAGSIS